MAILSYIVVTLLLAANCASALPNATDIFAGLEELIARPGLMSTEYCENPKESDVELMLYTRENTADPIVLDMQNPELNRRKPIIILIHGWMQSHYGYGMQEMKKAYLYRYDSNVIVVNWENIAWDYYHTTVCKVPKLAKLIAGFLCTLSEKYQIDLKTIHLVGHSLGAHISGIAGYNTQNMCEQKVGRITGLDPAGPKFVDTPRPQRLDSSDAVFVDVMHTNGGFLGYLGNSGHVDFYVNCGSVQLGCTLPDYSLNSIMNLPMAIGMCHHMRSLEVWAEAVETDNFKAMPCAYCPIGCPPVLSMFKQKIIMGERTPRDAKGGYYVKTDYKKPYAIKFLI